MFNFLKNIAKKHSTEIELIDEIAKADEGYRETKDQFHKKKCLMLVRVLSNKTGIEQDRIFRDISNKRRQ